MIVSKVVISLAITYGHTIYPTEHAEYFFLHFIQFIQHLGKGNKKSFSVPCQCSYFYKSFITLTLAISITSTSRVTFQELCIPTVCPLLHSPFYSALQLHQDFSHRHSQRLTHCLDLKLSLFPQIKSDLNSLFLYPHYKPWNSLIHSLHLFTVN